MSVQITFAGAAGRTVFRNAETVDILVELTGGASGDRQLQGAIRDRAGTIRKTLAPAFPTEGRATWKVDLAGLELGPHTIEIRPVDEQGRSDLATASLSFHVLQRPKELDFFPACVQFSPVPSGKGWKGQTGPLSEEVMRDTVDNIRLHGFTGLYAAAMPKEERVFVWNYAQSRGMIITYNVWGQELFDRTEPPEICVYSHEYAQAVRRHAEKSLAPLKTIPRLYNVMTYQDEPFHWGAKSFGYNDEVKARFKKRYGYELPGDLDSIRNDPKKWLDVINFRSDYFADGWRQVHPIIKDIDPDFKTVMTHDSHNTFGGGCSSHTDIAIDDVFHWGGDFADMFVFDIYPYMMFDFRFGSPARLPEPRISQMHYTFAQMRNLTRAYGRDLGFWVGTYNPSWFRDFLGPELQAKYWTEREMSTTAVAQGADFLLTGFDIPIDARHWESLGEGLGLIQKAGGAILKAPKVKAKACMLFPRTHYVQLQEEYFNVGLSFELFLRAFGELDILHEEQVTDDSLDGHQILVLFDAKLLPTAVAERIASFVRKGGVIIADCLPQIDEYTRPMTVMADLFGVKDAETGRIRRTGHWIPFRTKEPSWGNRPKNPPDESVFTTDTLAGDALGQTLDLALVSPRPCTVTQADVLLPTASGRPGVIHRKVGTGQVFLLGFCLQDTYFKAWQDRNASTRSQLRRLIRAMTQSAGVRPHVYSTNPDIEASIRANDSEAFLFIINHEAQDPEATVHVADLDFEIATIVDLNDNRSVPFVRNNGAVELKVSAPLGETRLLRIGQD